MADGWLHFQESLSLVLRHEQEEITKSTPVLWNVLPIGERNHRGQ